MASYKNITPAISFILIAVTIYWSLNSQLPDYIANANVSETRFSTARALTQLKNITKKPHYSGSEYHKEVREYIISELENMGLDVSVQTQTAVNKKWRGAVKARNILARIKGTNEGKALLILSHYDSSPHSSYGASDAGSGVVTILESLRAFLAKGEKPKNDIIILITDAEELGLLGANAFVSHHPWAKDVGLVLNFEARGSGGPSYMLLETNGGNKNLITAFKEAKPGHSVGNSLLYSIYKMLPNDTDLTVFREDGNINGFNFAFIDDHFDYHTAQDTYERLDRNTLLQQGEYLLPLMNYFARADLNNLNAETDDVFFNFPGTVLINYPFSWVMPIWVLAFVWFLIVLISGVMRKKLSAKPMLIGFGVFLLMLVLSALISFYGWQLLLKIYPQYRDILHGFTYNGHYYIAAFTALSLGLGFWLYNKLLKKYTAENILTGPIFLWLLLNFAIARYLPGAGFLIIPVLFALVIFTVLIFSNKKSNGRVVFFTVLSLPMLIILSPMIQMFPVGVGLKMMAVSAVLSLMVLGLLWPVFGFYRNSKGLTKLFFLLAILAFISAGFSSDYIPFRKEPNSILYVYDADADKAYWASYNTATDRFTQQFLGENPVKGTFFKTAAGSKYGTNFKLYNKAEKYPIPIPNINVLKDTIYDYTREISIRITPKRKANRIDIISADSLHFKSFSVNGEAISKSDTADFVFDTTKHPQVLSYYITENDSIVTLDFRIPESEKPEFVIYESSWDLFTNPLIDYPVHPRDSTMMPMPFVLNDAVLVKQSLKFD